MAFVLVSLLRRCRASQMVEFAGYYLPVQYKAGVLTEHNHTRDESGASLFDVSHMGQLRLTGDDAIDFLQGLVVGDIAALGSVSLARSVPRLLCPR